MKKLMPCPFCGTIPAVREIGNEWTKKRSIVIKCPKCRCQRTDATMRFAFDWLRDVAAKNWNQRP